MISNVCFSIQIWFYCIGSRDGYISQKSNYKLLATFIESNAVGYLMTCESNPLHYSLHYCTLLLVLFC